MITKHRVMAEVKEDGLKEKEERGCMTGGERDMHDVCRVCSINRNVCRAISVYNRKDGSRWKANKKQGRCGVRGQELKAIPRKVFKFSSIPYLCVISVSMCEKLLVARKQKLYLQLLSHHLLKTSFSEVIRLGITMYVYVRVSLKHLYKGYSINEHVLKQVHQNILHKTGVKYVTVSGLIEISAL